jgi:hypothetical protein
MATGLPALFCKTVVPVLDSAVLIRPAGTGDSGLRLCGAATKVLRGGVQGTGPQGDDGSGGWPSRWQVG